jgi:hypothetical protein
MYFNRIGDSIFNFGLTYGFKTNDHEFTMVRIWQFKRREQYLEIQGPIHNKTL